MKVFSRKLYQSSNLSLFSNKIPGVISDFQPNSNNNRDKGGGWNKILFSDLHVSTKTLDRCISVLKKIREISIENSDRKTNKPMDVVFLGDFWHQRNLLYVRHLDLLLQEFNEWCKSDINTTLLVGNHDQVTLNGQVHGLQMFSLYPNIKVTTEPYYDYQNYCAYLPWRESKEDQSKLFDDLKNMNNMNKNSWTVFAHAEIKGAISNGGYQSPGKIQNLESLQKNSSIRSAYLGHYHKRQQIGDNCWYIGSPYEQNYGEMYDPHGIAIVNSEKITPDFIDFNDLPKHHKLYYPVDFQLGNTNKLNSIREKDFVEVKATKTFMKSDDYINSLSKLPPSIELRRVMINSDINTTIERKDNQNILPEKLDKLKHNLQPFKLEDYIDYYVKEESNNIKGEEKRDKDEINELIHLGKDILSSIKQDTIVPIGRKVDIKSIKIKDFCGIKGEFEFNISEMGKMIMVRGEMGTGKSTIFEALVWALYGSTSPKKQSSSSSSIKGDEVINDQAKSCSVEVVLRIDNQSDDKDIKVKRSKKKSHGSKVELSGVDQLNMKQGVLDQQSLINNIIGMDYELFRMCVYMGQGSISNFVSDTDRRRKELLSKSFSLGNCIPAHKYVKEQTKIITKNLQTLEMTNNSIKNKLIAFDSINFQNEFKEWKNSMNDKIEKLKESIKQDLKELNQLSLQKINDEEIQRINKENSKLLLEKQQLELERNQQQRDNNAQFNQVSEKVIKERYEIENIQLKVTSTDNELNHLNSHKDKKICLECGQSILNNNNNNNIQLKITILQETQIENKNKLESLKKTQISSKLELEEFKKTSSEKLERINQLIQLKQNEIISRNKNLEELNSIRLKVDFIKTMIMDKENQLLELSNQESPFQKQIEFRDENIKQLRKDQIITTDEILQETHQLKLYEFWEQGFSTDGIAVKALHSIVEEIQSYANEYLSTLSQGKLFTTLTIENQDELSMEIFELDVKSNRIQPRSLNQLSGGQRRCVELVYSPFSLSETIYNHSSSRISLMIIDELSNHLDVTVKPIICDLIRNLKEKENIIVVDHDQSISFFLKSSQENTNYFCRYFC